MSATDSADGLQALREELDAVDSRLVELAAQRQQLVSQIGRFKQTDGRQLRDFKREREVLGLVRARAREVRLDPVLAEDLFKRLIDASLTRQEHERVRLAGRGDGRQALVIGGAGQMGAWLSAFFDNQGYEVMVADPSVKNPGGNRFSDWRDAPLKAPVIALAAPLRESADVLTELAALQVPGLVFDIGSVKTPLIKPLRDAAGAGLKVCSVHPMFGPDTRLLSGRHVLVMDAGSPEAVDEVTGLFTDTMAELVKIPLDQHDRLVAMVLGLSHALNIAFFTALDRSGIEAGDLAGISSTTFKHQLEIARAVAGENPALYFEIQTLNEHGSLAREALKEGVEALNQAVETDNAEAFRALMEKGRKYLGNLK